MATDVIVLGAGIVGVAAALHLQKRGRAVTLVDRGEPGAGTSYGNAGLIQREAYLPYSFPSGIGKLVKYALNGESEAHYQLSSVLGITPPLFKYWLNSSPERIEETIQVNRPLFENCLKEHQILAAEADITDLLRPGGWIQVYRKDETLKKHQTDAKRLESEFGVNYATLTPEGLAAIEPHLSVEHAAGAIHWKDPMSLRDPLALTQGYVDLFLKRGGVFAKGDAQTLRQEGARWSVTAGGGAISAAQAVVALGPWSDIVFKPLGYDIPLFVKRGYHMHYSAKGNATLSRTVIDADTGFALAAMTKGVRLTTGAEFADRDAPPTPILPDMRPVIGEAPRHKGLWFLFGHAHHGLTNGAVTGRLIAEMMTGETPFCSTAGFAANREFS
jgi:D-amino-acid dehydrogenase